MNKQACDDGLVRLMLQREESQCMQREAITGSFVRGALAFIYFGNAYSGWDPCLVNFFAYIQKCERSSSRAHLHARAISNSTHHS